MRRDSGPVPREAAGSVSWEPRPTVGVGSLLRARAATGTVSPLLSSQESRDASNSFSELRVLMSRILLQRQVGEAFQGGSCPQGPQQQQYPPELRPASLLCGKVAILLAPTPDLTLSHLFHRSPCSEEGTKGRDVTLDIHCHPPLLLPAPGLGLACRCPRLGPCRPSLLGSGPPSQEHCRPWPRFHPPACSQAVASPWRSLPGPGRSGLRQG